MISVKDLAAISLYTGVVLVEGDDVRYMYDILEKLEDRPVYTHEMPDIADKHKDELSKMVRDIYERAKENDKFIEMWNKYKECDVTIPNIFACDSCLVKGGEFCTNYCKDKE